MWEIEPLAICGFAWMAWSAYWFISALFVGRTRSSEGWAARMMHVLPLVAAFLLIFHHFGRGLIYGRLYDSRPLELVGVAMTLAGHSLAVWARVHLGRYWSGMITLKEDHELIRTGPYRWARHPIYSGFLLAVLGSAIAAGTGDAFIGFGLILIALLIKMRREEALMTREFGEQYQRFRREVAALVPFVY